jgi:hypothetical protein
MISPQLKQFLSEHRDDNLQHLALQSAKYPGIDMPFALQQLKGKRIAAQKIPTWEACGDVLYPKQVSMEQCSSETTARFKASLAEGTIFVDLTGGFGVDFYFMAQRFQEAIYVEQQAELELLARHNFQALGLNSVQTFCEDSVGFLKKMDFKADTIFIDPGRRADSGRKTVLLEDCTPNLKEIDDLLAEKSHQTIIKLSPMLDISASIRALKNISDVYVVAIQNEVKELLLKKSCSSSGTRIHAVNYPNNAEMESFSFLMEEEAEAKVVFANNIGRFLFEPNAALLKAGAYKLVSDRFSLSKLHLNSHLYTCDMLPDGFPGRAFEVEDSFSFSNSELKRLHQITSKANISIRNFPSSVDELRKKLRLTDGGDFYLFATTFADNQKRLVLTKKVTQTLNGLL